MMTDDPNILCSDCGWRGLDSVWKSQCRGSPCQLGSPINDTKPVEGDAVERLRADLECAKDYVSDVADGFGWKLCDPAIIATACSDHNRIVETLEATIPLAALASPQPGNEEVIERYVKTLRGYADGMERFGMLSHGYDAFSVSPVELREIADLLTKPAHQADGERS